MSVTLSTHQYPMLQLFLSGSYISIVNAQKLDQRPFGSLYHREWIAYVPGKGFHITPEGRKAWAMFQNTDIARKNDRGPLTHYFDAALYGLTAPSKKAPSKAA